MSLDLTPEASQQVLAIMKENKLVDHVVRVGANVDTAAQTIDYALDITDEVHPNDRTFTSHDVKIVCAPRDYLWVKGTTIGWGDGGFRFDNPQEA